MIVPSTPGAGAAQHNGHFDLAVVGAGSSGFAAAIAGAEAGARVVLIGHGIMGGTCVNAGCVPSKTLIRATEAIHHARSANRFGGIAADGRIDDWRSVVARKDALVRTMRQTKYSDLLRAYPAITYRAGRAEFANDCLTIDGSVIDTGKIIIATGATPAMPPIPGIESAAPLTSTTAMNLSDLPASLLVIGGGYAGCELAQMFSRAGVAVTIVCRRRLLPDAEPEIAAALTDVFRGEGLSIIDGCDYGKIEPTTCGVQLTLKTNGRTEAIKAERVLVATGRRPNTSGLGLNTAGIKTTATGGIRVDDCMRTSKAGVYAAGDVTGRHQFVYMAAYGARIAAENALNGDNRRYDSRAMPAVVFTDPQVASVGLTEAAARNQGIETKTSVLMLDSLPRALAARDTRGLIKLVAEGGTNRLIGAHILAPEGADSIQTATLAIKHGLTARELAETIFPYLTTVEGLKLTAQGFEKDVTKLSCCAG